jgi:hypothetical protein
MDLNWTTIGFVAADPGWRTVYREPDGKLTVYPMPGWLIQVYDPQPNEDLSLGKFSEREKRICGADVEGGQLVSCDDANNFECILSPGEEIPKRLLELTGVK